VNPDIDKHASTTVRAVRFLGTKSIAVLLVVIAGVLLPMVKRLPDNKEWKRKVQVQGVSQLETNVIPNSFNSEL
jgi:hypothetical protein